MCVDHLQLPGASEEESGALPWLPAHGCCRTGLLGISPGSAGKVGTTSFAFLPWPCPSKTIRISSPHLVPGKNRWRQTLLTSTFLLPQVQAQPVTPSGVSDLVFTIALVLVVITNHQKTQCGRDLQDIPHPTCCSDQLLIVPLSSRQRHCVHSVKEVTWAVI